MTITAIPAAVPDDAAGAYDRELIAGALALAALDSHEARVAYLTSHGAEGSTLDGYGAVRAAVMASMQHALASLARGYERELRASVQAPAVKVITDRAGIAAEIAACRRAGTAA